MGVRCTTLACLSLVVALTRVACHRNATPEPPTEAAPRFIGRFLREPDGAQRFAWGASTIEARFAGTECTLLLEDVAANDSTGNLYDVLIDNQPPKVVAMHAGVGRYPLGKFHDGEHTITIVKRTEAWVGEARFRGFDLGPQGKLLTPPPPRPHRLEFIGDSISAGYGNEGTSEKCPFTPTTENGDLAYGPMTARALNADVMVIAWSGKGVIRNRDNTTRDVLPDIYERILPSDPTSKWDFSRYTPDAVIVNLGTNDFSQSVPDSTQFQAAYTRFLVRIREHYPKAYILVAVGPMLSEMYPDKQSPMLAVARADIQAVVGKRAMAGDERISGIEFPMQTGTRGYGCDWHPSLATHAEMAQELTPELKRLLSW